MDDYRPPDLGFLYLVRLVQAITKKMNQFNSNTLVLCSSVEKKYKEMMNECFHQSGLLRPLCGARQKTHQRAWNMNNNRQDHLHIGTAHCHDTNGDRIFFSFRVYYHTVALG